MREMAAVTLDHQFTSFRPVTAFVKQFAPFAHKHSGSQVIRGHGLTPAKTSLFRVSQQGIDGFEAKVYDQIRSLLYRQKPLRMTPRSRGQDPIQPFVKVYNETTQHPGIRRPICSPSIPRPPGLIAISIRHVP
jgi:hypothetical protein